MQTWLRAAYLMISARKDISSVPITKESGVIQKTGWFLEYRIREAVHEGSSGLLGPEAEIDEAYIGVRGTINTDAAARCLTGNAFPPQRGRDPMGEIPDQMLYGIGCPLVDRIVITHSDITGSDFGTIFAEAASEWLRTAQRGRPKPSRPSIPKTRGEYA